jgi:hypothetical protein
MMALGDFATYVAVLSAIGWVPLAVTTNLTINFLRKPPAGDLVAEARACSSLAASSQWARSLFARMAMTSSSLTLPQPTQSHGNIIP